MHCGDLKNNASIVASKDEITFGWSRTEVNIGSAIKN